MDAIGRDALRKIIARIAERAQRTGTMLSVAQEADRLAEQFPDVSKRVICDMLIAAGFKEDLPVDMIDTDESCREPQSGSA